MTERKIGRYIIQKTLGQGAMGEVFQAHDPLINRRVAIKTILVERLKDPEERESYATRFFREAQICGGLKHPGLVTLHDVGEHEGTSFIVMEYVEGQLLSDRLATGEPFDGASMVRIVQQMAQALDAAHAHGVVHRDIKPQNVMLTQDGNVKILDFGIAKLEGKDLTLSGEYLGTPSYSSPEQITEQGIDGRSDLFSFAVLVHKLVTGRSIFSGSSLKEIFTKILYQEPKPRKPLEHLGLNPRYFQAVMVRALQKNPAQRYQKGALFARDVETIFAGSEPKTEPGEETAMSRTADGQTTQTLDLQKPESEAPLSEKEAEQMRVKRLKQWRDQFQEALAAENLMACRNLILVMKRRGENCSNELRLVGALETKLKHAAKKAEIQGMRQAFEQCMEQEDLTGAGNALRSLRKAGAQVEEETQQLLQRQREQEALLHNEMKAFNQTMIARNLGKARGHLLKLKKMGASVEEEQQALTGLEEAKMQEAKNLLKEIVIVRERFQAAMDADDLKVAEKALKELKSRKAPCSKEEEQFEIFKDERDRKKVALAQTLKASFKKVLKRDPVEAERTLMKLTELGQDLPDLRQDLAAAKRKHRRKRLAFLEKEFEDALNRDDGARARTVQRELASLDAQSPLYLWLLKKASGKDPGPRPRDYRALGLVGLAALVVAVLAFLILR